MSAALIEAARDLAEAVESMQATFGCIQGNTPEDDDLHIHEKWAEGFLAERLALVRTALAAAEQPAEPVALTPAAMKRGGFYNWKNQPDRLIYLRRFDGWHQFKKIGDPREVWCEVLDGDLHMLEETAASPAAPAQAPLTDEQLSALILATVYEGDERIPYRDYWTRDIGEPFARAIERAHGIGSKP